ncbi:hypothetical protein BDP55DRAFT_659981 [Colletotrichum godetiae]|uniref:Uncharacterized protein n=1 Tax=Colletotrichum godetiae TaxID=1209918 RepID=A0AAJ0APM3_9PEZI|nr:uncharacterized protein BDP55DRAFT_659981 [Colletotrichum godetiae]KAK1687398.1 hypothetical protein BDP55DRAFT_659981 [Colletotrichum godetiae]
MAWMAVTRTLSLTALRSRQLLLPALYILLAVSFVFLVYQREFGYTVVPSVAEDIISINNTNTDNGTLPAITTTDPTPAQSTPALQKSKPKYKPQPTWSPPPVKDPFPLLSLTTNPPPVPSWNRPKEPNVYLAYGLPVAPPLLISFTRSWPLLLQTVVGYITAGWPADQIFVLENTGVHDSNAKGLLSLQNPLFLNYTQLSILNVNVVRTPVLLSFAQLQNYFGFLAREKLWPYYFWSHMDSFVLSYEEGMEGVSGPVNTPDYQTIYELAVKALNHTVNSNQTWGVTFFAYDHLTLVNPHALDSVGGFDTFIPYYMTDCDMYWRLEEAGWNIKEEKAGIVEDVASVLDDLRVLYREGDIIPEGLGFTDPNPPPPDIPEDYHEETKIRDVPPPSRGGTASTADTMALESFRRLYQISHEMLIHKKGDRGRNTWQLGQRGGDPREPYAYDALGFQDGINVITEAGKEVFRRKWGHKGCDFGAAGLKPSDAWKVEPDWE